MPSRSTRPPSLTVVDHRPNLAPTSQLAEVIEFRDRAVVLRVGQVNVPFSLETGKSEYDGPYVHMQIQRSSLRAAQQFQQKRLAPTGS